MSKQQFVGLSDEEVQVMAFRAVKAHPEWRHLNCTVPVGAEAAPFVAELYRAIEAKLREKNAGKPAAEDTRKQDRWDDVPQDFRDWWNGDYDDSTNPFRLNSSAYWAWAGWKAAEDKAGGDEPVAHAIVEPLRPDEYQTRVRVNWINRPVSGPLYTRPQPQAEINSWSVLAARALDDAHRVLETVEPESTSEADRISELSNRVKELFVQALVLHGFKTRKEMDAAKHFNRIAIDTAMINAAQMKGAAE